MKAVMPTLVALLLVASVGAVSIKESVESFFIDETPDVVIGDQKHLDDQYAANGFMNEFGQKDYVLASKAAVKALVVIGGPCANPVWADYSSETCGTWDQPEGKAVIVSAQKDGKNVLLIGGTSGKDTRAAAKHALTKFSEAIFNNARVVLDTEGLPLASDQLIVYTTTSTLEPGQSSAKGAAVIHIPKDPSGGTQDLADGLRKYLLASYPYATVVIEESNQLTLTDIDGKVYIKMNEAPLISVDEDAPADHVVIASAAAFWLAGQGLDIQADTTHNQLILDDMKFG
ncbi:hypothetical protein HY493_01515 [Candidatus Woesearchaeota archaeon]|nr:hypothetical protein [Candidatus Woesearchaeota archaeon]